jgi:ribosomal protein S18 acetylase RimI-like enzyme
MIEVKEVTIEEALKVHEKVLEFNNEPKEYFTERYKDKNPLIIVAYYNNIPIGYIIGYDKFNNGSYYCWMAGVDNNYRRLGALNSMIIYLIEWMKRRNYKVLQIKTRNNRREMLSYLVKTGFNFTKVEEMENIEDNRIFLELEISSK